MNPTTLENNIVVPQRVADINASIEKSGLGYAPAPTAITSTNLQQQTPLNVPQNNSTNVASDIIATSTSTNTSSKTQDAETAKNNTELAKIKAQKDSSLGDLKSVYDELGLVGEKKVQAEEDANIPELTRQSNEITNKIEAKELSYRRAIENLDKNFQGTLAGKQDAINAIEKQSAQELADLSIIQNARNRNLLTAQSLVDKKIALQTDSLKTRAEYLKFFYDENKESFDKTEQRQFEAEIKKADRTYTEERDRVKKLEDTKLKLLQSAAEQGASNQVLQSIQSSNTPESAIAAAGKYGTDILDRLYKEAQINKLNSDAKKALSEIKEPVGTGPLAQAKSKGNIDLITGLSSDKFLNSAVGPNPFARISLTEPFTAGRSNFVAGVEQLRQQLTLDSLISAKEKGATFGALSEGELKTLSASASKLASWAVKDNKGNVIAYKATEPEFRKEMDKIVNFAKLDYLLKGGNLEDVDAQKLDDNTVWTKNSDGSYTQLYP